MTGSAADGPEWQQHIRDKRRREALGKRFKNAKDPFKIVIVRDMWLTGFDVPCLHTMYVDKPMRGHGLMQAIARVNRVFKDKPGGLVVDYLGIAHELKQALSHLHRERRRKAARHCPGRGRRGHAGEVRGLLRPVPRLRLVALDQRVADGKAGAASQCAGAHPEARKTARTACMKAVADLSKAFALAVPHEEAMRIRDDVGFFQAVRAVLAKAATPAAPARAGPGHTPSGRLCRGPWYRIRWSTSSPRRD